MDVKIPNLGDGVESATVLTIMVKPGDTINKDDTILELETDKAVAPIPSSHSGEVETIHVKVGDNVSEGKVVISLKGSSNDSTPTPVKNETPITQPIETTPAPISSTVETTTVAAYTYVSQSGAPAPTSPSIRKMATAIGLDLGRIKGSGNGGRITREDVKNYIQFLQSKAYQSSETVQGSPQQSQTKEKQPLNIDFSKWGPIKTEKASSLRQKIGEKLTETWQSIPHVTQFEEADITNLMADRKKHNPKYIKKGTKLTVTGFVLKAIVNVLKSYPIFNSTYDAAKGEIIYKEYYHIGVAVDTESGLIVPVIKDVDKKSLLEISQELTEISNKARDRKVGLEDLKGSTMTVSNLGSLGVGHFTPIINGTDVAILGLGRGVLKPEYTDKDKLEARLKLPICLSYDHRVIDGADGARFTKELVTELESFNEAVIKESL